MKQTFESFRNKGFIGKFADTINDFVSIQKVAQQAFVHVHVCTRNPNFHLLISKEVEFESEIFCVPVFVKIAFQYQNCPYMLENTFLKFHENRGPVTCFYRYIHYP